MNTDTEAAQQALAVLEQVQEKILLEMWTTIMLTAGGAAVLLSLMLDMFGLKRCAWIAIAAYGYSLTWVPAQMAFYSGYAIMFLSALNILKVYLARSMEPATPLKSS